MRKITILCAEHLLICNISIIHPTCLVTHILFYRITCNESQDKRHTENSVVILGRIKKIDLRQHILFLKENSLEQSMFTFMG